MPTLFEPTPEQIAGATPVAAEATPQPFEPTPEQISGATPVVEAQPVNPLHDFTPDQLVALQKQDPTFNVADKFLDEPNKTPELRQKAEDTFHQLRQEPWFKDLPSVGQVGENVLGIGKGFYKQGINYAGAAAGAAALAAAKPAGVDEQVRQEQAQDIQKKIATNWAGTESSLTGLLHQVQQVAGAVGRAAHLTKPLDEYNREDKSAAFEDALSNAKAMRAATEGKGPLMTTLGGNVVPQLNLNPQEVSEAAAGDPFAWTAFGAGMKGATGLARVAIPEAAVNVVRNAADYFPKAAAAPVIAGAKAAEVTGKGIEKAAPVIGPVGGVALSLAHSAGPVGLFGSLAYGTKVVAKAGKELAEGGATVGKAAKEISGATPTTGAYTQLGKDLLSAVPAATGEIAKGAAFDLGLAATSDTPQEKQAVGLGTTFGILGAAGGAARSAISGQLTAPHDFAGNKEYTPGTGTVPALENLTKEAFPQLSPGQRLRLNAARDLLKGINPDADLFVSPDSDATVKALTSLGYSPEDAQRMGTQGGVTTEINGHKVAIVDVANFDSAPHEARHAFENVLGENVLQKLDQEIQQSFGARGMDSIGRDYTSKLYGVDDIGPDWRAALQDKTKSPLTPDQYIAREIAAEHFDTWFKNLRGDPTQSRQVPQVLAEWAAGVMRTFGSEPLKGQSTRLGMPLSSEVLESIGKQTRGALKEGKPTVEPATTAEPVAEPGAEAATAANLAAGAPDVPVAGGTKSQREILGTMSEAIAQRSGVKLNYLSAPEEPAAAISSQRGVRRQMIELFRSMPQAARSLWEKTFFPEKVTKSKSGYQVQGWAPEVFAANAHKLAQTISETPTMQGLSPYEVDPNTKTFTPEAWQQLYNDVGEFVKNQQAGRTGSGVAVVVPKGMQEKGFFKPPLKTGGEKLDQRKADFISMLFNFRLPETARLGHGKFPLNVAGQEVSAATIPGRIESPAIPKPEYGEAAAKKFPELEGRQILEVNPVRNEFEQAALDANKPMPSFIEAVQKLNLENIKEAEHAPEAPEFRGNTLTLSAGFAPKQEVKLTGPDGKEYRATFDGYQDFTKLGRGKVPQFTALEDLPGSVVAKSTTYGPSLEKAGYKFSLPDETGAAQFAPPANMEEYEKQRGAYEATPWWKQEPKGETETGRHSSYAGDSDSGLVLHSAKQRSTVHLPGGKASDDFLKQWNKSKDLETKDSLIESYFGTRGGAQFSPADSAGVTDRKETKAARDAWQSQGTDSPYFKKWFGDSKVVDESGKPLVVYHGTTHKFDKFTPGRGNPENFYGVGHYFSSDFSDANENYGNKGGADITSRIENRAEQIANDKGFFYGSSGHSPEAQAKYSAGFKAAMAQATKELTGKSPRTIAAFVKLEKPFIDDPKGGGTQFEYNFDEDTGNETGTAVDLYNSIMQTAPEFNVDGQQIWDDITKNGTEFSAHDMAKAMRESDEVQSAQDESGNLVGPELMRQIISNAGFDGIIQKGVAEQFTKMGLGDETQHIIAFKGDQVKSVENRGTFNPADQRIQFAPKATDEEKKTFIVRHGSTEMNNTDPTKDLIRGHLDVPLDDKGRKEAQQSAQDIADQGGVDHVITSDLGRTQETAQAIADKNGATVESDPGLRPWHFGPTIEGKPTSEMLPRIKELTENPDQRPPGGETFNEFKDRFLDAFHKAQAENQDKNTAIVTHYRGTKLLDAWRTTGVDNDTIDKAVFESYDKAKKPGNVEVVDKTGAQFAAKKTVSPERKSKQDWELKEGPGLFSKAWILPDGKPIQLGDQMHHDWLNENPDVAKKYGIKGKSEENRVEALKKGFARINYDKTKGNLKVEARETDWPSLKAAVQKFAEANIGKLDSMDVSLLDNAAKERVTADGVELHTYDANEKLDHLPLITESTPPSFQTTETSPQARTRSEAQFAPGDYKEYDWADFGNDKIPRGQRIEAREGKPPRITIEQLQKEGFKTLDVQDNGSFHDYSNSALFYKDNRGEYPVTDAGFSKAAEAASKAETEALNLAWEDLYGEAGQFSPSDHPRALRAAAVKDSETGKVYEGPMHFYALQSLMEARKQKYGEYSPLGLSNEEGFTTNTPGEFLTRQQAFDRAKELDQFKPAENAEQENILKFHARTKTLVSEQVAFAPKITDTAEIKDRLDEFKNPDTLADALQKPGWAILTATQEAKGKGTDAVNQTANDNLEKALIADGYAPQEVKGYYKGIDQGKNFLVVGMSPEEAQQWGNKYGQESVLINKGLLYGDGTLNPSKHEQTTVGPEAKKLDFSSQIPGGPHFTMGIDFGKKVPLNPVKPQQEMLGDIGGTKQALSTKEVGDMTRAELSAHFPEAVLPKKADESIPSRITESPLYKQAGSEENAVKAFASKLVDQAKQYLDHPAFQSGLKWYSEFTPMLKKAFGKHAQMMAELLAATSPQNEPGQNYAYALDALERYKAGHYDRQVKKYLEGYQKIKDESWKPWLKKNADGGPETEANFLANWISKHDLSPTQSNGAKFGISSVAVLEVLARKWLGEGGLKTQNFVKNLLGTGHEATIDLWADRTMRAAGYEGFKDRWRILPKNATGVSDADFLFSQKAFRAAAEQLGITPDALQGGLWFAEKQKWADNGWGKLSLGDYRNEVPKTELLKSGIQQRLAKQKAIAKTKPVEQQEMFATIEPR